MLRCKKLHRVVCDKVCTCIAGSTICTSCEAGKFATPVVTMSGTTLCQSSIIGTYTYLQESDGRPAYVKADNTRFLFYLPAISVWVIGSNLGVNNGAAYVGSSAADALTIVGTWKELCGGAWNSSAGVSLSQTGSSACTSCEAGKFSAVVGATVGTCSKCAAGKYQSTAGVESVCVRGQGGLVGKERCSSRPCQSLT
jgi:hypothetical protein